MTKTMSIRMDRENLEFLTELTKEQRSDLSKAVREMVTRGRILLAVERSLAAGTPEALEPLTLIVESGSNHNQADTISHKEYRNED